MSASSCWSRDRTSEAGPFRRGAPPTVRGRSPVFAFGRSNLWEHRNVSQSFGLRHPRRAGVAVAQILVSATLAALLGGAVANDLPSVRADAPAVTGDLLVAVVWIGVAAMLWP